MKKILYFIAALSLVSAVSCVKEEAPVTPSNESMTVTLGFDGGNDPDRKAAISDTWGLTWNPTGTEIIEWDGGSYKLKTEDINPDNTVTFTAEGLTEGTVIYFNRTPVYGSYAQGTPGSTNWGKLYLKGTLAPEGEVTKMKIVGSMLRFIPYTTEYSTESVKSVTFESGATSYTVTITDPVTLEGADSKENAKGKSIYLPIAATTYNGFTVVVRTVSGAKFTFTTADPLVLDENTIENLPLPLKAAYEQGTYSVTFNTDGGTAVSSQTVKGGDLVVKPEGVTKDFSGSLAEGLYLGVQDPDNVSYTLEGWYTDAEKTQKYDFSTPVTGSLTLYAKWVSPEVIDLSGQNEGKNTLYRVCQYVNSLSLSGMTDYTVVLGDNIENWGDGDGEFKLKNNNVRLTVIGAGKEITLKNGVGSNFIICEGGVFVLGKNITISGYGNGFGKYCPVNINGDAAEVIMKEGSKISGIEGCTGRGIVYISNGTFRLDGGTITANSLTHKPEKADQTYSVATVNALYGKFIMNSGSITNNTVVNPTDAATCGGVLSGNNVSWAASLTKTGGVISGNTASIKLADDATPTAPVKQQVLWVYKNIGHDTDLSETDNI